MNTNLIRATRKQQCLCDIDIGQFFCVPTEDIIYIKTDGGNNMNATGLNGCVYDFSDNLVIETVHAVGVRNDGSITFQLDSVN